MNSLTKILLACSIPVLASCYPARKCRQSLDNTIYECRIIENFPDQMAGRYWRFTMTGENCSIDGFIDDKYITFTNIGCDETVDLYTYEGGIKFRDFFGSSYDQLFQEIKRKIGDKPIIEIEK